ncbi:kinesin-like protein [Achlya hypogyna]|uniref:Kinesin-like protein n=1 Tax=Achlya hypogyna TaxID=1202772 RepID=A0A1V9ZSR4_ACHHY|nr:kinesin-like protein [Achlya hypogyna]
MVLEASLSAAPAKVAAGPATRYFASLGNQSVMSCDGSDDEVASNQFEGYSASDSILKSSYASMQSRSHGPGSIADVRSNDMDDFVKMDLRLQMELLNCSTAEEQVLVYKVYVSKLLHELVITETASEDVEYELQLKVNEIAQLQRRIDDLTVIESAQTMSEFEDSVDLPLEELHRVLKQKNAEIKLHKARHKRSEDDTQALRAQLVTLEHDLSRSTIANRQLKSDLANESKRREESHKKTTVLRDKLDHLRKASSSPKKAAPGLEPELAAAAETIERLEQQLTHAAGVTRELSTANAELQAHVDALTRQHAQLEASHEALEAALATKDAELRRALAAADAKVASAEARFHQSESLRRKLHNQVMELKGNIRVFCRVRPPLPSERGEAEVFVFPDYDKEKRKVVLVADSRAHTSYMTGEAPGAKKWPFEFDQVFDWRATQEEMFDEVAALVQSAVDGYNVSIFAYGQTGSGKTYTMQGDETALTNFSASRLVDNANMGIVGRTMTHIFATCATQAAHGWTYQVNFEMYEIYNENIRDLMAAPGQPVKDISALLDADGNVHVTNLTVVPVEDERHAMQLLKQATTRRSMKKTQRNDVSSRSHCITTLRLHGSHAASGSVRTGAVYLIDLAGSERLKSSGSGNDPVMLKEAQNINKSLAALGNVISAIASKKTHVPFRDTKLTYVLQNTLGKDSKTLMICTLSPLEEHREESLNTLRFAKKVNACELALAGK